MTPPTRVVRQSRKVTFGPDKDEASEVLRAFGRNLTLLRAEASLTQQKLADRCFMRHDQIYSFEMGKRVPNLLALLSLAEGLGVSREALTEGVAAPGRRESVAQVLELLARRPGISTDVVADCLRLPSWYASELVLHLQAVGTIVRERKGSARGLWLSSAAPIE